MNNKKMIVSQSVKFVVLNSQSKEKKSYKFNTYEEFAEYAVNHIEENFAIKLEKEANFYIRSQTNIFPNNFKVINKDEILPYAYIINNIDGTPFAPNQTIFVGDKKFKVYSGFLKINSISGIIEEGSMDINYTKGERDEGKKGLKNLEQIAYLKEEIYNNNIYKVNEMIIYFCEERKMFIPMKKAFFHKMIRVFVGDSFSKNDIAEMFDKFEVLLDMENRSFDGDNNINIYKKWFTNGYYDLKGQKFYSNDNNEREYKPFISPLEYQSKEYLLTNHKETCRVVDKFLNLICSPNQKQINNNQDYMVDQKKDSLLDILTYAMTGMTTRGIFLLVGDGANYKSALSRFVRRSIGEGNYGTFKISSMGTTDGVFKTNREIMNKLVAWDNELDSSADLNYSNLKEIGEDGGTILQAKVLFKDIINFTNFATPIANTNNLPKGLLQDGGMKDRLYIFRIYFKHTKFCKEESKIMTEKETEILQTVEASKYLNALICENAINVINNSNRVRMNEDTENIINEYTKNKSKSSTWLNLILKHNLYIGSNKFSLIRFKSDALFETFERWYYKKYPKIPFKNDRDKFKQEAIVFLNENFPYYFEEEDEVIYGYAKNWDEEQEEKISDILDNDTHIDTTEYINKDISRRVR